MTPIRRGNSILVDGGVLNPVPMGPTLSDDSDLSIAVNLGGLPVVKKVEETSLSEEDQPDTFVASKMKSFLAELGPGKVSDNGDDLPIPDVMNVTDRTFDVMQNTIARQKLAANPPDYTIEIPRNACGTLDFDQAAEMIEIGHKRGKEIVDTIIEN